MPQPRRAALREARVHEPDRLGQGPRRASTSSRTWSGPVVSARTASSSSPPAATPGISLAMIGRRKGYRVAVVLPDNVTQERRQLLTLFGAEVIDSPGHLGSNGASRLAKHLVERDDPLRHALPVRQSREPPGPRGDDRRGDHRRLPGGGRLRGRAGNGRHARWASVAVSGATTPRSASTPPSRMPGEKVQGLRSLDEGFIPEIFDPSVLDGKLLVSNAESIRVAARADRARGHLRGRLVGRASSPPPSRSRSEMRRGTIVVAARRRRLEVPLRGHLDPRPGARSRGRREPQPVVSGAL